jgi:hypothetical protein
MKDPRGLSLRPSRQRVGTRSISGHGATPMMFVAPESQGRSKWKA